MSNRTIKCTVVGDSAVGKTCLIISYVTKEFPTDYIPTVFDYYAVNVMIEGEPHTLDLMDTAGSEQYDRLRPFPYFGADVLLLCFSVVEPLSFENVWEKWWPEIEHYHGNTGVILVGTKIDLRDDNSTVSDLSKYKQKSISFEQGTQLAKKLKLTKYVECSALTRVGLENVFEEATLAALDPRNTKKKKRKSNCTAL